MWIAQHPLNNSLVVLIHGLRGDRYATWEKVVDTVQQIARGENRDLRNYDVRTFRYRSGRFFQSSFRTILPDLEAFVSASEYDSVVLIGHSQGGILAKLFVIQQLKREEKGEKSLASKIDVVITLDTPHRGPQPTPLHYIPIVVGGIWKRLPLLNRFPLWTQSADLGFGSKLLREVRKEWKERISAKPVPPQPGKRHLVSATVPGGLFAGLFHLVVPEWSSRGVRNSDTFVEGPSRRERQVWTLDHSVGAMKAFKGAVTDRLIENSGQTVHELETALKTLPADEWNNLVAAAVKDAASKLEDPHPVAAVPFLGDVFERAFGHRPLRKLNLGQALRRFVLRHLVELGWRESRD